MSKKNKVNMNKIYLFIVICIILYYAVEFTENLNTIHTRTIDSDGFCVLYDEI